MRRWLTCLAAAIAILSSAAWPQGSVAADAPHAGILPPDLGPPGASDAVPAPPDELPPPGLASAGAGPAGPTIISAKILTPTVNVQDAPATPAIRLSYSAPGALRYIQVYIESSSGQFYYEAYYVFAPVDKSGTIILQESITPMSLYSEPGAWTVYSLTIADFAGHTTNYVGSALMAILPSATLVVNNSGTPDTKLPSVVAGKLLTPKVSLSSPTPYFEANLTVADGLSGVSTVYVLLHGPKGAAVDAYAAPPRPLTRGIVTTGAKMSRFSADVGTWTIFQYQVCNVPGLCLYDSNPADITKLFGTTTFKLTK